MAASDNFAARLREVIGGDRQNSAFSRETGVPLSTIRGYLKGGEPGLETLVRIAGAKGLSVHWLATGHGPRESAELRSSFSGKLVGRTAQEVDLPPEGYIAIPRFDIRASAGSGRLAAPDDLDTSSSIALRTAWLRTLGVSPEHAQFLIADGDSMRDTILDGDLLLIDRLIDRVATNSIYVVVLAGAVMVKRLQLLRDGAIMLISDNPMYQPERVEKSEVDELQIEGRVKWYGRAI